MIPPGTRLPDYGGQSLSQVLISVGAASGAPAWDNVLGLPPAPRYVVFLVDGLGLRLLQKYRDQAPYLSSLLDGSATETTCGLPSTTATSLTSIGTGAAPGRHGVVGYTSRIPGTQRLINALKWDDEVPPLQWQPHRTVFERLHDAGVTASVVNDAAFEHSGLTLCSQRGVPYHGLDSVWQRLDVLVDVCESAPRSVTYGYESRLDHTGHESGCDSERWRERLSAIDTELAQIRDALPDDAALLVTADHGMVDLPPQNRFEVDDVPALVEDVVLIGGEARFRHVYTRSGAADDVADRWQEVCGHRAVILTREAAEAAQWFGPVDDAVRPRIGDVVVAALDDFAVFSTRQFPVEHKMVGFHGSITDEEMLVPMLVDPPR